jgi:uncharacterized protein
MRIELASLEGGKGKFAHTYAPGELLADDDRVRLVGPAVVSGEIRQVGREVKVSGHLEGRVQVDCDRCLKPVDVPVTSNFDLEYVTTEDYEAQHAVELTEEDLELSVFDGESIDIDALVTEELLLGVPNHVICQGDCKGICPECGVDRNTTDCKCETAAVDPRWAGLQELLNREKT